MKTFGIRFQIIACLVMLCGVVPLVHAESEGTPEEGGAMDRAREARLRASCQNNLKQMGIVFKMFANESQGERWPYLSPEPGRLMFDNAGIGKNPIFPEYLTDMRVLVCPADEDMKLLESGDTSGDPEVMIDDQSYYYLGYALHNEDDFERWAKAYEERIEKGLKFDEDIETSDGMLHVLREGVERFLITDINNPAAAAQIQSKIPILIERPDNHKPAGGNVLFMDGHVEYLRLGGKWPMTEEVMATLKSLEALKAEAE